MTLVAEDIEQIEHIVKRLLANQNESRSAKTNREPEFFERFIRLEEELKHQRELMRQGFEQMDKRFEQVDKRFEQIDKRLEQVDKRFEQVDKRFEQVDKRFEQQHQEIMAIHQEIKTLMRWSFGALIGLGGLIVGLFRLMS